MLLREYAIEWWFIIPPLLTNVSALPRETWTRKLWLFSTPQACVFSWRMWVAACMREGQRSSLWTFAITDRFCSEPPTFSRRMWVNKCLWRTEKTQFCQHLCQKLPKSVDVGGIYSVCNISVVFSVVFLRHSVQLTLLTVFIWFVTKVHTYWKTLWPVQWSVCHWCFGVFLRWFDVSVLPFISIASQSLRLLQETTFISLLAGRVLLRVNS